jgi:GntR family transcriptional regulator
MLHLQLDPGSAVPVYRQVMDQVKYYAASGALGAGDRLPSIRELAKYLGVNPTTIVKAYTELEHEGVIERKQGKGAFITGRTPKLSPVEIDGVLRRLARQLAVEAKQMGIHPESVLRVVREELRNLSPKARKS